MGKYVMNEFDYRDLDSRFKIWMDRKNDALKFNALSLSWELDAWEEVEEKVKQRLENKIKNNNDALRLLETQPDSEKDIEDLHQDNENILRFIKSEERKFRDLKFHMYEHSPDPDVRELMREGVDTLIAEYLTLTAEPDKDMRFRYQDLLFLSYLGGQPAEDGLYRFRQWMGENFPPAVPQAEMAFLAEIGLIESDTEPTYHGDNLTPAGSAVLARLNEDLGPSTAELFIRAYLEKPAELAPSV